MKPSDFELNGHKTYIDLWSMVEVAKLYEKPNVRLYHPQGFTEVLNRIEEQIARLKWCEETCFAHLAWARFDFHTVDANIMAKRLAETQEKLARIANRYPPRNLKT